MRGRKIDKLVVSKEDFESALRGHQAVVLLLMPQKVSKGLQQRERCRMDFLVDSLGIIYEYVCSTLRGNPLLQGRSFLQ